MQDTTSSGKKFIARQPILDGAQTTVGYELLFRSGEENVFSNEVDSNRATRSVIDESLVMSVGNLCEGQRAFVNCTRDAVVGEFVRVLPPQQTAIEIVETVVVSEELLQACRRLKRAGYTIALDDFVPRGSHSRLLSVTDVVKIDIQQTPLQMVARELESYLSRGLTLLAEKVETNEEFKEARALGFTMFQGYFFARPAMVAVPKLPALTLSRLQLLQCIARAELDYIEIERIIKGDAALCYRLLRYLNSALFQLSGSVDSVRHGLNLLGDYEIRRWVSLLVAVMAVEDKPAALLQQTLLRARFCESIGKTLRWPSSEFFLLGLFSLLDAILGMPIPALLESVSLPDSIRNALLGCRSVPAQVLQLIQAYETAQWTECESAARMLGLSESTVSDAYVEAATWTRAMFSTAGQSR